MKKLGLSTRVFIGFGLGILLGVIFGEKVLVIKIIGDIFLKLIKMLTVPLVFFSIISGITNLTDVNKLKRVGAKILGMYVVTTLLAGFIGLGIAHLINPGIGFQIDSSAIGSYEATAMNSVSDTLLAMVPDNIINAMANTNMMGIIIFCAIFGCANTASAEDTAGEETDSGDAAPAESSTGTAKAGITDAPLAIEISCKEGSEFDAGLACQNMSAEAQLLGYGTKIISSPTIALNGEEQEAFRELLGIPDDQSAVAVLLIGKADTSSDADAVSAATTRKDTDEVVTKVSA